MTKYTRETICNPDGSVKQIVYLKDSFSEKSIFDENTFSMPEDPIDTVDPEIKEDLIDPIDPVDPEIKFGKKGGKILEKETYRIKQEEDIWNLLINRLQNHIFNRN